MKQVSTFAILILAGTLSSQTPQSPNVHSSLHTVTVPGGVVDTLYTEPVHFEAPNWSPDGSYLVVNSEGLLYRIAAEGPTGRAQIPTGFANRLNNDHGISPDGSLLAISHEAAEEDGPGQPLWHRSAVYVLPIDGSAPPRRVTPKAPSFWHGWSPDGSTMLYTALRDGSWDIYAIPVVGGQEKRLTTCEGLDDGAEFSPDGKHIYYNSFCSGSMEIWRMGSQGEDPRQLTRDTHSNWFPHPSPDGRWLVFLSYLEDQGEAHPFGRMVKLRLMDLEDESIRDLTKPFYGGQGTINVPSWSPDSRQLAFVSYRDSPP